MEESDLKEQGKTNHSVVLYYKLVSSYFTVKDAHTFSMHYVIDSE